MNEAASNRLAEGQCMNGCKKCVWLCMGVIDVAFVGAIAFGVFAAKDGTAPVQGALPDKKT